MYIAISIIIVIASVLLILVVLIQNSKGGGLAANFATGNQTFGVRQTTDFLEKTTWVLAAIVLVLSISASFFTGNSEVKKSKATEQIQNASPLQADPAFPVNPATDAQPVEAQPAEAQSEETNN